jgi:hypothetical protein
MSARLSRLVMIGLLACAFQLANDKRPQPQQTAQATGTQPTEHQQPSPMAVRAYKLVEGQAPPASKFVMR